MVYRDTLTNLLVYLLIRVVPSFRGRRVYTIIIPTKSALIGLGNNLIIVNSLSFNNILELGLTLK